MIAGKNASEPIYLPSPEEIAAKCREFQATWSDDERIKRRDCKVSLIDCDYAQVHRDALAKLETRLAKREAVMVVEDTSRRGDAVPWELEPLALG
jgi:hypothetical protein